MDFLRIQAHLAGGDTHKTPKNTQFSKSRHTTRGQGSPPRQPLSITTYHGIPTQSFLIQIPYGLWSTVVDSPWHLNSCLFPFYHCFWSHGTWNFIPVIVLCRKYFHSKCAPAVVRGLRTKQPTGTRDNVHTARDLREVRFCRYQRREPFMTKFFLL